ncbi:MAG TPA: glucan biosynthesis protein D, partial [Beijerinckiaceae bacterium]|nr:glucan biosynthesis protein D [Beijerinckiaceae bacterium]
MSMIVRRDVLKGVASGASLLLSSSAFAQMQAQPEQPTPFQQNMVLDLARSFAKSPFKPSPTDMPEGLGNLNYDQY